MEHQKFYCLVILAFTYVLYNIFHKRCNTVTTVSGSHIPKEKYCPGALIFEENFDKLDLNIWQHEQTLTGGKNWEFQWYTNNRSITYVTDGILHIKPHLLTEYMGDPNFIYEGQLDINGGTPADQCTNAAFHGCLRVTTFGYSLNPIVSASIRTVESFNFKYGKLEAKARIPAGDWLWPAIWMLPKQNHYSFWPSSGEIDIMESRGNKHLMQHGRNIGTKRIGSTIHWGINSNTAFHKYLTSDKYNQNGFDSNFHRYQLEWTPDFMSFSVDDELTGIIYPPSGGFWELGRFTGVENPWKGATKMAPFDQEFYIIMNLACGGIMYFPDDAQNPGGKPWKNNGTHSFTDFWEGKNQWLPTWHRDTDESYHFLIDYIRVWAL